MHRGHSTRGRQHYPSTSLNTWPNFRCSNCVSACPAAQLMATPGAFLLQWLMPPLIRPLLGIACYYSSPTARSQRPSRGLAYFDWDSWRLLMANGDERRRTENRWRDATSRQTVLIFVRVNEAPAPERSRGFYAKVTKSKRRWKPAIWRARLCSISSTWRAERELTFFSSGKYQTSLGAGFWYLVNFSELSKQV